MVPQFPGASIRDCDEPYLCTHRLVRLFQIVEKDPVQPNGPPATSLVEIGPRFVLTPIRIFEGAFGGATVFSNPGKALSRWENMTCSGLRRVLAL